MALLVGLKIFQTIGRFLPTAEVPLTAIEHVARRMGLETGTNLVFSDRTLYRHRLAILMRLNVISWGPEARTLVEATMRRTALARTDPACIINSAVDALIRHGFELPALVGVDLFSLSKLTVGNLALAWGWFGKLMIPLTILSIFQSVSDGVDA